MGWGLSVSRSLKPLASMVAKRDTIVVHVCNLGQSELLMNFICNSRARGFDISSVLVFATDVETQKIAEALGVASFHDAKVGRRAVVLVVIVSIMIHLPHLITPPFNLL